MKTAIVILMLSASVYASEGQPKVLNGYIAMTGTGEFRGPASYVLSDTAYVCGVPGAPVLVQSGSAMTGDWSGLIAQGWVGSTFVGSTGWFSIHNVDWGITSDFSRCWPFAQWGFATGVVLYFFILFARSMVRVFTRPLRSMTE